MMQPTPLFPTLDSGGIVKRVFIGDSCSQNSISDEGERSS